MMIIVPVVLLLGRWGAVTIADHEWAASLGAGDTHATITRLRMLLFLFAFFSSSIWFCTNLYLVYRSIGSVHVPRRLGDLEIIEAVPRGLLLTVVFGLGVALALAVSHNTGSWWYIRALAGAERFLGVRDPVLGKDLAYYLFQLPWHRTLHGFTVMLTGISLAAGVVLYAAVGAVRWEERRITTTVMARYHMSGLLTVFALVLFWGYRLEPAEYIAGFSAVPVDSILTDLRIPVARILSGIAVITALASLAWIWVKAVSPVLFAWGLLALTSFAVHYALPAMMATSRSPAGLEVAYVEAARREFTNYAYGMAENDSAMGDWFSPETRDAHALEPELSLVPVWDQFVANLALNRSYNLRPSETFFRTYLVDLDPGDSIVPGYVGVRAIDLKMAHEIDRTLSWEEVHTGRYTATRGAAAMLAARQGEDGAPVILKESELAAITGVPDLDRVPLRFGPDMSEFAVLADTSDSTIGVRAGSMLNRVMLGWALQSHHIITSGSVHSGSRVAWRRDVTTRLRAYAPFADFDDVFPVPYIGGILWVAHGYVSAAGFPLSGRVEWRGRGIRYFRAGFLGTVDASTGATALYLVREPDPLAQALGALMPELVRDWADLPGVVRSHLQYPRQLFERQLTMLEGRLARTDSAAAGGKLSHSEPSPWFDRSGPAGSPVNLAGILEAGPSRRIVAFATGRPADDGYHLQVRYGDPSLSAVNDIGERLSQELRSAGGILGSVRVVPVGGNVLAYLSNFESPVGETDLPRISGVAVGWLGGIAGGADLEAAVQSLEGTEAPGRGGRVEPGVLEEARHWFKELDRARRDADWAAFGRAWTNLRRLLMPPGSGR